MRRNYTLQAKALFCLLLCLMLGALSISARTVEQAKAVAAQLMSGHSPNKIGKIYGIPTAKEPLLVHTQAKLNTDTEAYYYVFSAGDNCGYSIISGDDRMPAIVGYTTNGNYAPDRLPDGLAAFMLAYQDFTDHMTDKDLADIQTWKAQAANLAEVAPLMTCQWNQSAPYNNLCPEYASGKKSVTGCVATAIAQILYYHKTPTQLTADIPAYTSSSYGCNMPAISQGFTYDWANMADRYDGAESAAQQNAVAQLMLHVGCAVQMNYGPSSGASADDQTFSKYFGMDSDFANTLYRINYNINDWNKILYKEMAEKRPVYYTGQSTGGGHAFVINGYRDGLYYVNWGWGGYCDGYFDITILNPYSTSGAGASSTDDGYSFYNSMVIGIQPDNGVAEETLKPKFTATNFTNSSLANAAIAGDKVTAYASIRILNFTNEKVSRYVSIGYADTQGALQNIGTPKMLEISQSPSPGYGYYQDLNVSVSFPVEEGKTYRLYGIESKDGKQWVRCLQSYIDEDPEIKITNGRIVQTRSNLTAKAEFDSEYSGYAGMANTINITVSNTGDREYYDMAYIRVGNTGTMPTNNTYACGITAPVSGSTTFSFTYTPTTAGTYTLWILDKDENVIGQSALTFQAATAPVLSFTSIKCTNASTDKIYAKFQDSMVEMNKVYGTEAEIEFTIQNSGGFYQGNFHVLSYTGSSNSWTIHSTPTLQLPANSTTSFKFTAKGNIGETVGLYLLSAEGVDIAGLKNPNIHIFENDGYYYALKNKEICYLADGGTDGIELPTGGTPTEDVYYNLRGERVTKPGKGVYIKNGKKYVFK